MSIKSRAKLAICVVLGLACGNGAVLAAGVHKAHTHGAAELNLAYEGGALEVELEAPAMSLLGFEHKPKTDEQVNAINRTLAILNAVERVFNVQGADCQAQAVNIDIDGPAGDALGKTKSQHKESQHEESHHKESHHKEHDHHHVDEQQHSEILANYTFNCGDKAEISAITIKLFDAFPKLENITVNWVTEEQQGQSNLRPGSSTIKLN